MLLPLSNMPLRPRLALTLHQQNQRVFRPEEVRHAVTCHQYQHVMQHSKAQSKEDMTTKLRQWAVKHQPHCK